MPIDLSYDAETKLVRLVGHGVVTMQDRADCFRHLLSAEEYADGLHVLANVSGITNPPINGDAAAMPSFIKALRTRFTGRIAIVNMTAGHVTISHMLAFNSDPSSEFVRAFVSDVEALNWING